MINISITNINTSLVIRKPLLKLFLRVQKNMLNILMFGFLQNFDPILVFTASVIFLGPRKLQVPSQSKIFSTCNM